MDKTTKPMSGWIALLIILIILGILGYLFISAGFDNFSGGQAVLFVVLALVGLLMIAGLVAIQPNTSRVLTLFGKYSGTIFENGFFWVNPLLVKRPLTLRAHNLDTKPIKVNDKIGNPIMIGAVVVWKVESPYKAAFEVDNYLSFVETQCEAAIRKLAGNFAYDDFESEGEEITLRSSANEVNELLEDEISDRLKLAGIKIIEARISHLAYSTEIAGAMLQRQQATAIVAARSKIVEGAVGMVEMALHELSKKQIVTLDEDKKAAMVSNLMVVLCSERGTTPVVNTGSLYN